MLSYLEISKENLLHNLSLFKKIIKPDQELVAVVKANSYGHGVCEVAQVLDGQVDYFQVDDLLELEEIRQYTKTRVLVLGFVAPEELERALELDAILSVYDLSRLALLNQLGESKNKIVTVHVKIDAALGRQGVLVSELDEFIAVLKKSKYIEAAAIYSHFANIEDTSDFSHAQKQLDAFRFAQEKFAKNDFKIKTHISASSGILVYEAAGRESDIARLGLALYGMWPSAELRGRFENDNFKLKPILRWVTHIAQVKTVPAGYSIGYGLTYVTNKPTKIAVIPQGYSDGYDRGFSNIGQVLISGEYCRILGRVAMNMFVVDVSHLEKVEMNDEVVLLGMQGIRAITAEDLAAQIGTINYEITTRIWPKLPRVLK